MVPPLPNYLRMYRKRSGLAQHEVARLLGTKEGSKVSRYENGDRFPSFDALLAYEILFQVSVQRLFAGETHRAQAEIRKRAQALLSDLGTQQPTTASLERKKEFLASVMYSEVIQRL